MSDMLDWALRYAALGWFIFPLHSIRFDGRCGCGLEDCQSPGKHPRIKWKAGASCDPEVVRGYWSKWPNAGIGLACGPSELLAADADGPKGVEAFRDILAGAPCPPTARARTARGVHVFFRDVGREGRTRSNPETKLDTRGAGGFVVLAPSPHVSGHVYRWEVEPWPPSAAWGPDGGVMLAAAPAELVAYSQAGRLAAAREGKQGARVPRGSDGESALPLAAGPAGSTAGADFTRRLAGCLVDWHEVDRALASINPDVGMDEWIKVGMALHAAGDSGSRWDRWSSRGSKYRGQEETVYKWTTFKQDPDGIGLGSLFVIAREHGFSRTYAEGVTAKGYGYNREEVMPIANRPAGYLPDAAGDDTRPTDETRPPLSPTADGGQEAGAAPFMNGHSVLGESVQKLSELPSNFNETPIQFPDVTEGGKVKATCANAIEAIRGLGITCEFDEFHERSRVGGQVMSQWAGDLSDNIVHRVRVLIREHYQFDPGNLHARDALVQACLCRPFHPIKDYLNSLQWDGIPRIKNWMHRYLGAVDDVFNREVSRLSLIAAVRRIFQPGCKFDQIIVFDAREGVGKSTAIEILAGRENFSDQAILDRSEERQQEALQGVWLYEIADLAGHSRAEVEKVKAFASRTTDRARPAYGHFRVDRPRQCILFGTTNPNLYLQSATGNRRFWPVTTGMVDLEGLRRDRDQLWAEAMHEEKRGGSLVLNPKLWSEAAERQESRRETDPWEDRLSDIKDDKISSRNVIDIVLQIPAERQSPWMTKRIAHAMRKNGWDGPKTIHDKKDGKDIKYKGYTKTAP